MRALRATLVLSMFIGFAGLQAHAQSGQTVQPLVVTPTPATNPAFTNCMIGCGTQTGACQSSCLSLSSGAAVSSTGAGSANSTQCYLNCTSQQLVCQQSCPRQ